MSTHPWGCSRTDSDGYGTLSTPTPGTPGTPVTLGPMSYALGMLPSPSAAMGEPMQLMDPLASAATPAQTLQVGPPFMVCPVLCIHVYFLLLFMSFYSFRHHYAYPCRGG